MKLLKPHYRKCHIIATNTFIMLTLFLIIIVLTSQKNYSMIVVPTANIYFICWVIIMIAMVNIIALSSKMYAFHIIPIVGPFTILIGYFMYKIKFQIFIILPILISIFGYFNDRSKLGRAHKLLNYNLKFIKNNKMFYSSVYFVFTGIFSIYIYIMLTICNSCIDFSKNRYSIMIIAGVHYAFTCPMLLKMAQFAIASCFTLKYVKKVENTSYSVTNAVLTNLYSNINDIIYISCLPSMDTGINNKNAGWDYFFWIGKAIIVNNCAVMYKKYNFWHIERIAMYSTCFNTSVEYDIRARIKLTEYKEPTYFLFTLRHLLTCIAAVILFEVFNECTWLCWMYSILIVLHCTKLACVIQDTIWRCTAYSYIVFPSYMLMYDKVILGQILCIDMGLDDGYDVVISTIDVGDQNASVQ